MVLSHQFSVISFSHQPSVVSHQSSVENVSLVPSVYPNARRWRSRRPVLLEAPRRSEERMTPKLSVNRSEVRCSAPLRAVLSLSVGQLVSAALRAAPGPGPRARRNGPTQSSKAVGESSEARCSAPLRAVLSLSVGQFGSAALRAAPGPGPRARRNGPTQSSKAVGESSEARCSAPLRAVLRCPAAGTSGGDVNHVALRCPRRHSPLRLTHPRREGHGRAL